MVYHDEETCSLGERKDFAGDDVGRFWCAERMNGRHTSFHHGRLDKDLCVDDSHPTHDRTNGLPCWRQRQEVKNARQK